MDTQIPQASGEAKENKYLLLLLALLAVVMLIPIHHELTIQKLVPGRSYFLAVLFVVVMIFGVRTVSTHPRLRQVGTGLWIVALIAHVIRAAAFSVESTAGKVAETTANVTLLAGLVMLTVLILGDLFRSDAGVTRDRLRGAACAYLLMGVAWALAYILIYIWSPGSLVAGDAILKLHGAADSEPIELGHLTYYSFVTLTTLGYGDITPVRPLASTLAWLEALAGQFYLTVLVAFLVGRRLATWMAQSKA